MAVVMIDIHGQERLQLTPVEDQHPVETLAADRADEALGEGVGPWAPTGVRMIRIRSDRNTSSKLVVNLVSRSRTKNRTGRARSASIMVRLRACWTTHEPVGLNVTPVT